MHGKRKITALILSGVTAFVIGGIATLVMTLGHSVDGAPTAADSMGHRPAKTAILLGMFQGTIETRFGPNPASLYSANFNYGTSMIDSSSSSRTVCVPGRIQDPLDTITLCGSNAPNNPRHCVSADPSGNSFNLSIQPCNAVGTLWTQDIPDACPSAQFTNHHFTGRVIAMDEDSGDVAIARVPPIAGWYYNMFAVPLC